jgi:pimeloyl-ACP methyl ester carboxylesterase
VKSRALAFALVAGCAAAPPPKRTPLAPAQSAGCPIQAPTSGEVIVQGANGPHPLYWTRLPAKTRPAVGTLFYLAGGPKSHLGFERLAVAFQAMAYPQLDVVLYDYFGFNCSSVLQSVEALRPHAAALTIPAMAGDFIQLKRALVGDAKVYLMGGSHGAMLGAQIVADHPNEIERAVLFSGDTESGWLAEGWFRFDGVISDIASHDASFAVNLRELLARAGRGELSVEVHGQRRILDRPSLEVALWLAGGLQSSVQRALPHLIRASLDGHLEGLTRFYAAELELLAPVTPSPPPTEASAVTFFYRCNVWFPRSMRAEPAFFERPSQYLDYRSFASYWTRLCERYDALGEFPQRTRPPQPTEVPILSWIGSSETFEPQSTAARFARLTTKLEFDVMPGWSHDFGPTPTWGILTAAQKVKDFLSVPTPASGAPRVP